MLRILQLIHRAVMRLSRYIDQSLELEKLNRLLDENSLDVAVIGHRCLRAKTFEGHLVLLQRVDEYYVIHGVYVTPEYKRIKLRWLATGECIDEMGHRDIRYDIASITKYKY